MPQAKEKYLIVKAVSLIEYLIDFDFVSITISLIQSWGSSILHLVRNYLSVDL